MEHSVQMPPPKPAFGATAPCSVVDPPLADPPGGAACSSTSTASVLPPKGLHAERWVDRNGYRRGAFFRFVHDTWGAPTRSAQHLGGAAAPATTLRALRALRAARRGLEW